MYWIHIQMSFFIPVDFVNAMFFGKNVCLTRIAIILLNTVLKGNIKSYQKVICHLQTKSFFPENVLILNDWRREKKIKIKPKNPTNWLLKTESRKNKTRSKFGHYQNIHIFCHILMRIEEKLQIFYSWPSFYASHLFVLFRL